MLTKLKEYLYNNDIEDKGYIREAIFHLIINHLEIERLIKFSTRKGNYLTKENMLNAFTQTEDPIWKSMGYAKSNGFSKAIQRVASEKLNPKGFSWNIYLLKSVGYKYCNSCNICLKRELFGNTNKVLGDNKGSICLLCDSFQTKQRKRETILHIIDVMIREDKLPECSVCGYKENWAALDFHHIDSKLERPEYSYNQKTGEKYNPGSYILGYKKEIAEKRYLEEMNNLELLCANCHMKHHHGSINSSKTGVENALEHYGRKYECEIDGCNENVHLHGHHINNLEDKRYLSSFSNQTKDGIIKYGNLKKELDNGLVILCPVHHMEEHYPHLKMEKLYE